MCELVSKADGGCTSACFHWLQRPERAQRAQNGSGLGPSEGISTKFDWFLGGNFRGFWRM